MGWFARWRLRRVARPYARRLATQLRAGWGGSRPYTRGQVDAAIRKARLNPRYAFVGYAVFLSAEDLTAAPELLGGRTLAEIGAAFARWAPRKGGAHDDHFYESRLGESYVVSEAAAGRGGGPASD